MTTQNMQIFIVIYRLVEYSNNNKKMNKNIETRKKRRNKNVQIADGISLILIHSLSTFFVQTSYSVYSIRKCGLAIRR